MTLVILAAGMGSRYGGMKQIDPITGNGEFIIDYSIYDAVRAGFDRVVIVVKRENLEDFKSTVGTRIEKYVKTEYAFQELDDLPQGFSVSADRLKPWGTAHALLSARNNVADNFAVINADDFYGRNAFEKLASHLSSAQCVNGVSESCMVGYVLGNTLTENGSVSRGQCFVNSAGYLDKIIERKKIVRSDRVALYEDGGNWIPLPLDTTVSMNCFGFTPDVFGHLQNGFAAFLAEGGDRSLTAEYYLPAAVAEMISAGHCRVSVTVTEARWYGVTYKEDKPNVVSAIRAMIEAGEYPPAL